MLDLLRIKAEPVILEIPEELEKSTADTFQRIRIIEGRKLVRSWSERTAVTFLYLPNPGKRDPSKVGKERDEKYMEQLNELTVDCPPTLMVRGVSPVTSITL